MRKLLFFIFIFVLLSNPALADDGERTSLSIMLDPVQLFVVNNAAPLTFSYDQYSDFGVNVDIGDISYDLISNVGWAVEALLVDTTSGGQTSDDWDDSSWTLTVNGTAIDESLATVIDTDTNPVNRDDAIWDVSLNIPWPEGPSTPDCIIQMTASTL